MGIRIGELNKRIDIVGITTIQDDWGFGAETEGLICRVWSKVSKMSGTETLKSGSDFSTVKTRFLVRYRQDVEFTTSMKVKYKEKLYNIVFVNNYNESNEFVELMTEVVENV